MTDPVDPLSANIIVGKNQAKGYDSHRLSHERHLDALFNRNTGELAVVFWERESIETVSKLRTSN